MSAQQRGQGEEKSKWNRSRSTAEVSGLYAAALPPLSSFLALTYVSEVEGWGRGLPGGSVVKNVPAVQETRV